MARTADTALKGKPVAYRYEALTSQGTIVKGELKSLNEVMAIDLLAKKGYQVTTLEVAPTGLNLEKLLPSLFGVKPQEVIIFSRQIAALLDAGITLLPALEITQAQTGTSWAFKKVMAAIIQDIRTGHAFSWAIARHSRVFGEIYCRTIATAEQTGELQSALRQMVQHLEKTRAISKKLGRALSYPIMVLVLSLVVTTIFMTTALPPMLEMFISMNIPLPLPTRILMGMIDFSTTYKFQSLGFIFLLTLTGIWSMKQPSGRRIVDQLSLKIPVIGITNHMAEIARFSRTLSVLTSAGLPLHEIMQMMPETTNNSVMRNAIYRVYQGLLLGEGLAAPMSHIPLFPPLLVQMVNSGEQSNTLDSAAGVVAEFYETAAEERATATLAVLQPLVTIIAALLVGFIALSVIMPIYTLTGTFD